MASALRVAIAGTGFIGAVHARSARLAGARLVGVSASSPSRSEEAAPGARRRARLRSPRRRSSRAADVDVVHICTPEPPPPAARRGRAGRRQARGLREAAGAPTSPARGGSSTRPPRPAPRAAVPVRLPLLPDGARGARARAHRRDGPGPPRPRHLPAGLADATRGRQLARRRGARRRLARVRRHRLALVRPRRVRHRPPHRPPQRPHAHRGARAPARRARAPRSRRGNGGGETRAVDTEDAAVMQFETDGGAVGSDGHQPDLAGPQEPPVARGRRRGASPWPSTRRSPRRCGSAAARAPRWSRATSPG